MATATSFAPARRWMPPPSRAARGVAGRGAARRLRQWSVAARIALGCLLFTLLVSLAVQVATESAGLAESHAEDRPLDVVSGMTYRPGTRLRIPGTDWSFVVPDGWQSNRPDDAEMPFLVPEAGKQLGMMFPLAGVTREALRDQLREPLSLLHGLSFIPAGTQVETEEGIAQSYVGEEMAGRALAVTAGGDRAVIYFVMGPPEDMALVHSVLEQLGQSTRFGEPASGRDATL